MGTGRIARTFAEGLLQSRHGRLMAVGSRSQESAHAFAQSFPGARAHGSYEALLADPEVDGVYLATPHSQHAEWAIRVAEAGKALLCEKPMTLNLGEAMQVAQAAAENHTFLMEAYMYRCHPQTQRIVELIEEGAIGKVGLIEASFGFHASFNPESRLFSNALAGGGILDVGGYPVSMVRLLAGAAMGCEEAVNPLKVRGFGRLAQETGVDLYAAASLQFAEGVLAQVATGVGLSLANQVRVFGSDGSITVGSPWVPSPQGEAVEFALQRRGKEPEQVRITPDRPLYALEADAVVEAVRSSRRECRHMPVADTLGNMRTLDLWRNAIGLEYETEKPARQRPRRPLSRRANAPMRYGSIPGVDREISRLIMGVDNQQIYSHGAAMFDDFFERGGNAFDTAWIYGDGVCERLLGHWLANRGVRDQSVVIVKGVHTPYCYPEFIGRHLSESLERLQMEKADIYIMHRDNEDVPAGEFIDALNAEARAGRIGIFGGSNWSLARIEEANRDAASKGLSGMSVVSNNFSLARMVDPVWSGCISSSDPDSRNWLRKHRLPLLAWSSQARGFFTERAAPNKTSDKELVRCWYSEDNFRRRERAIELAAQKRVEPINISLAYVLVQPFPTFALIGPRTIAETVSSLGGLQVELTPEEVEWLAADE
jgi:predicted dehydrogenase/aryl-alcohol dehydrogenase-like predicted oxidoreductase